ncbi:MAG: ATP-binding protein, partial [Rhodospirillales bacterium]
PFNPLEMPDPDVEAALEDREIGGLGIFLARQMMDVIRYRRADGFNCLTLVKLLPGEAVS